MKSEMRFWLLVKWLSWGPLDKRTGQTFEQAGTGLFVEAFNVSLFAHLQGRVNVDFDEVQVGALVDLFDLVTVL